MVEVDLRDNSGVQMVERGVRRKRGEKRTCYLKVRVVVDVVDQQLSGDMGLHYINARVTHSRLA